MPSRRSATATSTTSGVVALHAGVAARERVVHALFKDTGLSPATVRAFRSLVKWFYRHHGRKLPWRDAVDPYRVYVSEVMLQQTQVDRVARKFPEFTAEFPDFAALARASVATVLRAWQGMGYNRRALNLKRAAEMILSQYGSELPRSPEVLKTLPGIGAATAASIAAFAFNSPTVFLETNLRAVFIHYFFAQRTKVHDKELIDVAEKMIDANHARNWYNGLMDLGTWLKATHGNAATRSTHNRKQEAFHGSMRQLRGMVIKWLVERGPAPLPKLQRALGVV